MGSKKGLQRGAPKRKRGRPVGSTNVVSGLAKENVIAVFTRLGGTHAMATWAKRNKTEFYRMYARLMPHEVTTPPGQPLEVAEVPADPLTIGKYYERLAQIAADRAAPRPARAVGAAGVPDAADGQDAREG
jgi:hypothetical protein